MCVCVSVFAHPSTRIGLKRGIAKRILYNSLLPAELLAQGADSEISKAHLEKKLLCQVAVTNFALGEWSCWSEIRG